MSKVDIAYQSISFQQLEAIRVRGMHNDRAVITGSRAWHRITMGLGNQPGDEGILADVTEVLHGATSGRIW